MQCSELFFANFLRIASRRSNRKAFDRCIAVFFGPHRQSPAECYFVFGGPLLSLKNYDMAYLLGGLNWILKFSNVVVEGR